MEALTFMEKESIEDMATVSNFLTSQDVNVLDPTIIYGVPIPLYCRDF
jgi:hypothetical protein